VKKNRKKSNLVEKNRNLKSEKIALLRQNKRLFVN
jgi:hypothetical protein